jgi:membrane-associated phospholipid phosphatase
MALLVAVMAIAYFLPGARHVDKAAVNDFESLDARPVIDAVATVFGSLCDWIEYTVIVAAFLWLVLRKRGPRIAATAALLLVGANVSSQVLKQLLAYPRDHPLATGGHHIAAAAYPSGHATAAMALAAAVVLVAPRSYRPTAAALGVAFSVGVSFSILVLGWHFVSDIIGGFLLATAWSLIALAAYRVAAIRWPVRGGMRSAARRAFTLADWRVTASAVAISALLCAAVVLTRIGRVVTYAQTHTSFVVALTAIATSAAALLACVAALSSRRG